MSNLTTYENHATEDRSLAVTFKDRPKLRADPFLLGMRTRPWIRDRSQPHREPGLFGQRELLCDAGVGPAVDAD